MNCSVVAVVAQAGIATPQTVNHTDKDGLPFVGKLFLIQSANAVINTLSYQTALNNGYAVFHGADTGVLSFADTYADIFRFGIKCASGGIGAGYSIVDLQADLFFAGSIQRQAKITNVQSGSFDITYTQNDRSGDTIFITVLGGSDLNVDIFHLMDVGTYTTTAIPKGVLNFTGEFALAASGGMATGAGGGDLGYGWDTPDGNRGALNQRVFNQGGNVRYQRTDACSVNCDAYGALDGLPIVSSWNALSYTVSGPTTAHRVNQFAFSGANIVCKAGNFDIPVANGNFTVSLGVSARWIKLATNGAPANTAVRTDQSQIATGWTNGVTHVGMWAGESAVGNVSILGARYLSNNSLIRTATPNGGSTTFANILTFVSLSSDGLLTLNLANSDGTQPQVIWFAMGASSSTPTSTKIFQVDVDDEDSVGLDYDTPYQAYIISRAKLPSGELGKLGAVRESYLTGRSTAADIQLTLIRDFGKANLTSTVAMAAATTGTHVTKKFEDAREADIGIVQFKLGDAAPIENAWSLDSFHAQTQKEGEM